MDAHHLLARHGEHAKRIVITKIGLARERKPGQIAERSKIVRSNARGVEAGAVMRDVVVGVRSVHFKRCNCNASTSSRLAVSMASSSPGAGFLTGIPALYGAASAMT